MAGQVWHITHRCRNLFENLDNCSAIYDVYLYTFRRRGIKIKNSPDNKLPHKDWAHFAAVTCEQRRWAGKD